MFQLVYASTAARMFTANELLEVLPEFREKNLRTGITGLLLYKHGSFMQALEGEEQTVLSLYAAIREDPRHHHVITLMALPVAERQFPRWTMGFVDLGAAGHEEMEGFERCPDLPPPGDELSWQASVAKSLLANFNSAP